MSSLIQIKYGLDSSGNVLSLTLNPNSVGSYRSEINRFYILLNGIDATSVPLSGSLNFQTKLEFYAATGSPGATGAGNFMEALFNNAVYSEDFIYTMDFQTPGYTLIQSVISA